MIGDIHKPMNTFVRWIDTFYDGQFGTTKKGKHKVPSLATDKRYARRWRRHTENLAHKDEV